MADFNPPRLDPASMAWNTVASYSSYQEAQAAVDRLSDQNFPVENLDIVGSDLRTVERVTGRLTTARATMAGAASGAWFGLFIGLLVGLFTRGPTWIGLIIGGLLIGAVWGAVFGFASHAATRRPAGLLLSADAHRVPLRHHRPRRPCRSGPVHTPAGRTTGRPARAGSSGARRG